MTANADGTVTTTRYWADSVSDIAWTAWPGTGHHARWRRLLAARSSWSSWHPRSLPASLDQRYFAAAKLALDLFGRWFGPYPWPKLTLVVPPANADGAPAAWSTRCW